VAQAILFLASDAAAFVNGAMLDVNGGRMDGFLAAVQNKNARCTSFDDPNCVRRAGARDVLGYHDERELPNYWKYARDFVLQCVARLGDFFVPLLGAGSALGGDGL